MKRSRSIQLKAASLLIVFSLNIVLVFACSIGINMGYNNSHHQDEKAAVTHTHDNSHHEEEKAAISHTHDKAHSHDDEIADKQQSQKSTDDCCTDEAQQFAKMDKRAPKSLDFNVQPVFFAAFFSSFYHFDILSSFEAVPQSKYFVRGHHPPIPEIRIAIQSFLI